MSDFDFNHELFVDKKNQDQLKKRFGKVYFAFHYPELNSLFLESDRIASSAKMKFRIFGLCSVLLAIIALGVAAIEAIVVSPHSPATQAHSSMATLFAGLAALFGVLSFLIGWVGMGISRRKKQWMIQRLIGERLRQWQGQYICSHLPEIIVAARDEEGIKNYLAERADALSEFKESFIDKIGARLTEFLEAEEQLRPDLWVSNSVRKRLEEPLNLPESASEEQKEEDKATLEQCFDAYDQTRFTGQIDYCAYMLGHGKLRSHPVTQHKFLSMINTLTIFAVLILHVGVVVGVLFEVPALKSPWVHASAIIAVLLGLGSRILEDGLQPAAHIARLRAYSKEIAEFRYRYRRTPSARSKFNEMRLMEETAVRESMAFMETISSARYIL